MQKEKAYEYNSVNFDDSIHHIYDVFACILLTGMLYYQNG